MPGIGIGLTSTGSIVGEGSGRAILIDDPFFELSSGELQPRLSFVDNNDVWDLDGNSDIQPTASPTEEGYFDIDGNGDIQPKA